MPAPQMTVCEMTPFSEWADRHLSETSRASLTDFLAAFPTAGDLVPHSGGVRKLRWRLTSRGKRGGARVVYFFGGNAMPLFLIMAYDKLRKVDLTSDELKRMRELTAQLKRMARI
jgi:hypothetical protein